MQPDRLVRPSVVPLAILTIETFSWIRKSPDDVYGVPIVSGCGPRVRCAFENGCQHEAVFLTIGTPGSREFLEDAVIRQPAVWGLGPSTELQHKTVPISEKLELNMKG